MIRKVNIALVGCGDISRRHLAGLKEEVDRVRLHVCCDTNLERAQHAAQEGGDTTTKVTSNYHDILNDPEVTAVDLCLPHHLHASFAIAAAQAGKHILCEKPLALTPGECDAMISAAKLANVVLMHLEPQRMSETVEIAAKHIRAGLIGRVVGLQAAFAYWQRAELNRDWRANAAESGGGHLMDGGIHLVDVMRHIGGEVVSVHAMTSEIRPELGVGSEDLAALNMRYANGSVGQMFCCHATRGRGGSPTVTVFGVEGVLTIDGYGEILGLVHFRKDHSSEILRRENSWHRTYERVITHFLDVLHNGATLLATPEDGRENVRLVLAAYRSAKERREVSLSEIV